LPADKVERAAGGRVEVAKARRKSLGLWGPRGTVDAKPLGDGRGRRVLSVKAARVLTKQVGLSLRDAGELLGASQESVRQWVEAS
jgi:hypothetical protein